MKILLLTIFLALANADVSHLVNQQYNSGYQYENPASHHAPQSSYGAPQGSVLGSSVQSVSSGSSLADGSLPQLILPSPSGPSVGFSNLPSSSGVSIQSYSGFAGSVPNGGFQVSSPSPTVDLASFQVANPSSIPSVNLVQYSQPTQTSSSYQFLSKLSQPSVTLPAGAVSSLSSSQFGSDASLNSGISSGFSSSNQFSSGTSFGSKTSGGNLNDAFGVVTSSASDASASGASAFGASASDASGSAGDQQESEVAKHLYFFAAPEEEEQDVQAKIDLPPTPPKKTYKIIFIKAPTYRNQAAITIPAPPQNEEKTLVYVLVKKPEGQPKFKFQDAAPTQPTKPEVFFIKYKTQQEAEAAVAEIQSKHGASGQVIANLPAGSQAADTLRSGNGLSVDSLGANSFVSSAPAAGSFANRVSEISSQVEQGNSQQGQGDSAASGAGEVGIQVSVGPGSVQQSPNSVAVEQGSVNSPQVVGGGIVVGQNAPAAAVSEVASQENAGVSFESVSQVVSGSPSNSNASESSESPESSESSESNENAQQNSDAAQNLIEQRVGAGGQSDSDSQGSQLSAGFAQGFARYGPPKY